MKANNNKRKNNAEETSEIVIMPYNINHQTRNMDDDTSAQVLVDLKDNMICKIYDDFLLAACKVTIINNDIVDITVLPKTASDVFGCSKEEFYSDLLLGMAKDKKYDFEIKSYTNSMHGESYRFSEVTLKGEDDLGVGAVSLFYPGLLKTFTEKFGDVYVMIPHKFSAYIIPVSSIKNVDVIADEAARIFNEVDAEEPKLKLSRHLYKVTAGSTNLELVR